MARFCICPTSSWTYSNSSTWTTKWSLPARTAFQRARAVHVPRAQHRAGHKDPYADGGGPALLSNQNHGPRYTERTAQGIGTAGGKRRTGHLSCLQRTSRAADGTPLHIRMDGPGFDAMAVPSGASVQAAVHDLRADAEFFRTLRTSQA